MHQLRGRVYSQPRARALLTGSHLSSTHPALQAIVGDMPLSQWMQSFLSTDGANLAPQPFENCRELLVRWRMHERQLEEQLESLHATMRSTGAPVATGAVLPGCCICVPLGVCLVAVRDEPQRCTGCCTTAIAAAAHVSFRGVPLFSISSQLICVTYKSIQSRQCHIGNRPALPPVACSCPGLRRGVGLPASRQGRKCGHMRRSGCSRTDV